MKGSKYITFCYGEPEHVGAASVNYRSFWNISLIVSKLHTKQMYGCYQTIFNELSIKPFNVACNHWYKTFKVI
jgi:hypothetical protein